MFKTKKEKERILNSVQNIVVSQLTDSIFDIGGEEKIFTLREEFDYWEIDERLKKTLDFMKSTKDPRYIRLSTMLISIFKAKRYISKELKIQYTELVTRREYENGFSDINSTYNEFIELKKRCYNASKEIMDQLKEYQAVVDFYNRGDFKKLYIDLVKEFGEGLKIPNEVVRQYAVDFLDAHDTLFFMYSNRNLKRM